MALAASATYFVEDPLSRLLFFSGVSFEAQEILAMTTATQIIFCEILILFSCF